MAVQRIDIHTHVFNVRYLPAEGIIRSRGIPEIVARGLAKLLNARTGDEIEPHAAAPAVAALAAKARVPEPAGGPEAVADLAATTPKELIDDPDVREALAFVNKVAPKKFAAAAVAPLASTDVQPQFAALFNQLGAMQRQPGLFESAEDYIRWFHFLTHSERVIMQTLLAAYGDDVQLFVHHMMDMSHYYPHGRCFYDFVTDQLPRMRRLVAANKGRLLTFVAYSPERPNDLNVVLRALDDADAAGVKFYPPNGYLPNEKRHDALYSAMIDRDRPLFAHCTPVGFEAKPHSGLNSDPKFWAEVLERFPKLRLCLAHSGGDEPWFHPDKWDASFAPRAVELAAAFDNVYLEFGYHDDILNDAVRENFIARLSSVLQANPALGRKIMYGSDWHIIARLVDHQKYFRSFATAFEDPRLRDHADAFFFTNAHDYLNLPQFQALRADTHGEDDAVVTHLGKVIRTARAKKASPRSAGRRR